MSNTALARHYSESEATTFLRQIWGHTDSHRVLGTGENDWHTPIEHIEAAKKVKGRIDLDPASSAKAQRNVKAIKFRTPKNNGLSCEWKGKIWLNPPYSQPDIMRFIEKLVSEYTKGSERQRKNNWLIIIPTKVQILDIWILPLFHPVSKWR